MADPILDPVRTQLRGRPVWLFADGAVLPVVSGGADDVDAMKAALRKANAEAKKYRLDAKAKDDELAKLRAGRRRRVHRGEPDRAGRTAPPLPRRRGHRGSPRCR